MGAEQCDGALAAVAESVRQPGVARGALPGGEAGVPVAEDGPQPSAEHVPTVVAGVRAGRGTWPVVSPPARCMRPGAAGGVAGVTGVASQSSSLLTSRTAPLSALVAIAA